jgi:hypothetical protein
VGNPQSAVPVWVAIAGANRQQVARATDRTGARDTQDSASRVAVAKMPARREGRLRGLARFVSHREQFTTRSGGRAPAKNKLRS